MHIGPVQLTSDALVALLVALVALLVACNALTTCMLGWLSWRTERRAIRAEQRAAEWERTARNVVRRSQQDRAEESKRTVVAPAWHAPRTSTPGQRLAHLVHTAADFRVEAED